MRFLSRIALSFVTLGAVALTVFLLIRIVPGDPVGVMLGEGAAVADHAALRTALGLDRPLHVQLADDLIRLARLDLGDSLVSRRPVAAILGERIGATLELAFTAFALAILIAFPLGVWAAVARGRWGDAVARGIALAGISVPSFWLGPLLVLVFAMGLGWFPVSGREAPGALVLPALTLALGLAAPLARMLRGSLIAVFSEDYMRTARAKGASASALLLRHALPNALIPVVTVLGLQLGGLLTGAVITEVVFDWPGLGSLTVEAIQGRDYPVVQGCVLLVSAIYIGVNAVTELVYAWIDPRAAEGTQ